MSVDVTRMHPAEYLSVETYASDYHTAWVYGFWSSVNRGDGFVRLEAIVLRTFNVDGSYEETVIEFG
ncbi:MAG: hypothetical protein AAGK74_00140 [Chloroflexota bacterium]